MGDSIRAGGLVDIDFAGGTAYVSLAQDVRATQGLAASVAMTETIPATMNVDYVKAWK